MENRKKILIVDDTAMFRELESLFLAGAGTVLGASTGAEALEIARREQPDVLVADLDMPDMDGETLCRAIKADRDLHRTPVILVTSGRTGLDRDRAIHSAGIARDRSSLSRASAKCGPSEGGASS